MEAAPRRRETGQAGCGVHVTKPEAREGNVHRLPSSVGDGPVRQLLGHLRQRGKLRRPDDACSEVAEATAGLPANGGCCNNSSQLDGCDQAC